MPCEVPLPRTVTRIRAEGKKQRARGTGPRASASRFDDASGRAFGFDETHAELVEDLLEHLTFLRRQIAARFLLEQRENLDHLRGAVEVRLRLLARHGIGEIAEMNGGGAGERQHERRERQSLLRHFAKIIKCPTTTAPLVNSPGSSRSWPCFADPRAARGIASRRSTR